MTPATHDRPVRVLRGALLAVFVAGALGTGGELLLVGHFEDAWQLVPLGLLGAGLLALVAYGVTRAARALRLFRVVLLLFPPAAMLGLYLHYRANAEFKLETYPEMHGMRLFWEAIQGASPPSLAPGAMLLLAVAGLAYSFDHSAPGPRGAGPHTKGAAS